MPRLTRRQFVQAGTAAGAAFALRPACTRGYWANEQVNLGFISCGSRAGQLMRTFASLDGVRIGGLCDPDEQRLGSAKQRFPEAKATRDLRKLLDDDALDAVVVATCNHWHCLAAIWAMEAGKHVYVEKPLSHNQWEGRQTVAAARKYGKVCQVGTQQRSDPMQAEIKKFLHEDQGLGRILATRVNRFGVRGPIGKRETPLKIDPTIDYGLWLGPAEEEPIYRSKLHYDWHWDWNTGSGEMGNWGVHVLDDVRNNVFRDSVKLPRRILGGGGRVAWNDAGETPNVHFVYFDTGSIPVVIGLSNLTAGKGAKGPAPHPGPGSGYIVYCEGGRLEGQRGRAAAFDSNGKLIRKFQGNSGGKLHQLNFVEAVRKNDPSMLNTDVQVGHDSTGWCNLANIAARVGGPFHYEDARQMDDGQGVWQSLIQQMDQHLKAHEVRIESDAIRFSPLLEVDTDREQFVGEHAEDANRLLRRSYRKGFEVPALS